MTTIHQNEIELLTQEVAMLREKLNKKFSAETLHELDTKSGELTDLKARARSEQFAKENARRRFLNNKWGTAADFERLWVTKLRDEVLTSEREQDDRIRHSIYNTF